MARVVPYAAQFLGRFKEDEIGMVSRKQSFRSECIFELQNLSPGSPRRNKSSLAALWRILAVLVPEIGLHDRVSVGNDVPRLGCNEQ